MRRNGSVLGLIAFIWIVLGSSIPAEATTYYVDCSAAPGGDGASGNPFNTIQDGLNACTVAGDEVEVADGTCMENLMWPAVDNVRLYSASGNPSACIVEGISSDVISVGSSGDPPNLTIEGLRIQDGGTGVHITSASQINATFNNTEIINNEWCGILSENGNVDLTVTDSTIANNLSSEENDYGAGIMVRSSGSLTVTGCTIHHNDFAGILIQSAPFGITALIEENQIYGNAGTLSSGLEYGAGIFLESVDGHVDVIGNEIYSNYDDPVTTFGSVGIYILGELDGSCVENTVYDHFTESWAAGGILLSTQLDFLVDKNFIFDNRSNAGSLKNGGLLMTYGDGPNTYTYTVTNNIIASNRPNGIFAMTQGTGQILITNNTVVDNAVVGIEEMAEGSPEVVVTNCIVGDWNSGSGADDLLNVTATYSNIEDGDAGTGNISSDPNFVDANGPDDTFGTLDDDYHLQMIPTPSPCINVGDNSAPNLPSEDFEGDSRIISTVVDMGADEADYTTIIELEYLDAVGQDGAVLIAWGTASEVDTEGFNILRSTEEDGEYAQINDVLIPAEGGLLSGADYEYVDNDAENGTTYWYKLEDVDIHGVGTLHGPVSATPSAPAWAVAEAQASTLVKGAGDGSAAANSLLMILPGIAFLLVLKGRQRRKKRGGV